MNIHREKEAQTLWRELAIAWKFCFLKWSCFVIDRRRCLRRNRCVRSRLKTEWSTTWAHRSLSVNIDETTTTTTTNEQTTKNLVINDHYRDRLYLMGGCCCCRLWSLRSWHGATWWCGDAHSEVPPAISATLREQHFWNNDLFLFTESEKRKFHIDIKRKIN